jgi:hypothetical protein
MPGNGARADEAARAAPLKSPAMKHREPSMKRLLQDLVKRDWLRLAA